MRKTLPSLYEKAPVKFEQNAYYRSLMKFMSTRKVKFNYQGWFHLRWFENSIIIDTKSGIIFFGSQPSKLKPIEVNIHISGFWVSKEIKQHHTKSTKRFLKWTNYGNVFYVNEGSAERSVQWTETVMLARLPSHLVLWRPRTIFI